MKKIAALLSFSLFLSFSIFAQEKKISVSSDSLSLPFFDDFEETIQQDATFSSWVTENLAGWHYWHIFYGKMRFENNDQNQNDWLITLPIKTTDADSLLIKFNTFYKHQGTKPKLFYTTEYTGDAQNDTWIEIEYELGEDEEKWHSSGNIIIKSPAPTVWFAFHSNQEANKGIYFLLDNFSVSKYEPINIEKLGETEHFEFYTSQQNSDIYWNEIAEKVDEWYLELCSYWDRPGIVPIFSEDEKINIYLLDFEQFQDQAESELPNWKCGYIKDSNSIITKLPLGEDLIYDNSYSKLVKNTLGQYVLKKHLNGSCEDYFKEGFGLFYTGYLPNRDSILKAINNLGNEPSIDKLTDINRFASTFQKDLITSYVEAKVLSVSGVQGLGPGGHLDQWHSHLEYYYNKPDDTRIKLQKQTERFNIYAADSDISYLNKISYKLEDRLVFYENTFEFPIKHRLYCVVYPTIQSRGDCLIISGGNGGAGWSGDKLDFSSKNEGWSEDDYYDFLIPHELFHVFHFNIVKHLFRIPAFYAEGLANYISGFQDDGYLNGNENDKFKIEYAFNHFSNNYNVDAKLEHILNSQADTNYQGYYNDPYYFGELYYKYFIENEGDFTDLTTFFLHGLDYQKIGKNYSDIDVGYINFIKEHANLIPSKDLVNIPFHEGFNDFDNGWGKPSYYNSDNWKIINGGVNGTNCARFYTQSNKNEPLESWLISPPLNAKNMAQVNLSFDFSSSFNGIELDLFYTSDFNEFTDSTQWDTLKSINMPNNVDWINSGEITIMNPPDILFIGLRKKSTGEQYSRLSIDNFKVIGNLTSVNNSNLSKYRYEVYPNPITSQSALSFYLPNNETVVVSIHDIQGRKIKTLLNKKLPQGPHSFHIGEHLKSNGIYICMLKTQDNISTIKVIKQ